LEIEPKFCKHYKQICYAKSGKEHSKAMNAWQDFRGWLQVQFILDRKWLLKILLIWF